MYSNYFTILDCEGEEMITFEKLQKFLTKSLNSGKHKFETLEIGDDEDNWLWEFEVDGRIFKLEEIFEEDEDVYDRIDNIEERIDKLENPYNIPNISYPNMSYPSVCPKCGSEDIYGLPIVTNYDWLNHIKTEYKCNVCGNRWFILPTTTTLTYSDGSCNGDCNCKKEGE